MDNRERQIRRRLRDDFPIYAERCLRIRSKDKALVPLTLNAAQRYIHERLETQRRATGRVRALIIKGRQQGCSTYVEGRFYWQTTHRRGTRAFILTHEDDATKNIFEMAQRYHEHCPALVRPRTGASNAKELLFSALDSGYRVATAGRKDAGRSGTTQLFHGSEVAFWPNADTHMAGAVQTVPDLPGTEIILESTSNGPQGMFYEKAMQAMAGQGEYQLIFTPWFWQEEYRKAVPDGWEATSEERDYGTTYGLTDDQLAWRRAKIEELGGLHVFRREYPATVEEAFLAEVPGALWRREYFKRRGPVEDWEVVRLVVAVDPAATSTERAAETGIIVAARLRSGDAVILEDASCRLPPLQWATRAVACYERRRADRVVAEANQGGEMVEQTLRTVLPTLSYRGVHASRGKQPRAEPVSALYEKGKVWHAGHFPELENQCCTWVPGDESPDRMDAMVWAITDLMLGDTPIAVAPSGAVRESQWTT